LSSGRIIVGKSHWARTLRSSKRVSFMPSVYIVYLVSLVFLVCLVCLVYYNYKSEFFFEGLLYG
jgi:uncharacterized membrane protein YidH (DUF202 family)